MFEAPALTGCRLTFILADKFRSLTYRYKMSKRLFVGNLSFQTSESDVTNAFEQCGTVESVAIITDRSSGRSKGFGFVVMDEKGADAAISRLHGSQLLGRTLTVNEAKPMVRRDFGGGDRLDGRRDRY